MIPPYLYVHIPFCKSICHYCDFPKIIHSPRWEREYVPCLLRELSSFSPEKGSFRTIYLGGGTPTSLGEEGTRLLLGSLRPFLREGGEFTVEANPESLDDARARLLFSLGANRLSLGAESFRPEFLKRMGRKHTPEDIRTAVRAAREAGFQNISLDLIYGLPGEGLPELKGDVERLLSLRPEHLSCYSLSVLPGTKFHLEGVSEQEDGSLREQYDWLRGRLGEEGYERYEVSSFSLPGYRSRHNLAYWMDEDYLGIGMGAAGCIGGRHYRNSLSLSRYLSGEGREWEEPPQEKDRLEYYFLTRIRLREGFPLQEFERKFGFPFLSRYGEKAKDLERKGLAVLEDGSFRASEEGLYLLDRVLLALF